jgi:hypothetical protein
MLFFRRLYHSALPPWKQGIPSYRKYSAHTAAAAALLVQAAKALKMAAELQLESTAQP